MRAPKGSGRRDPAPVFRAPRGETRASQAALAIPVHYIVQSREEYDAASCGRDEFREILPGK